MPRHTAWWNDPQRRFDATGRLPPELAGTLAETAHRTGAPGWVQSSLLLGSAHDGTQVEQALGHLARVWRIRDTAATAPVQRLHLRVDAARHLFTAGCARDALALLDGAAGDAWGPPWPGLACRALATLIALDLGRAADAPAGLAEMLAAFPPLAGRMTRRDRMWLTADLIQATLALCWRAGGRRLSLGCRLPGAGVGPVAPAHNLPHDLPHNLLHDQLRG